MTLISLYCQLIYNITAIEVEIFHFVPISVSKVLCPEFNPDLDVNFQLFTKKNVNDTYILKINDTKALKESNIDFNCPTVFFFHGFLMSTKDPTVQDIKNSYLENTETCNVILVNMVRLFAGINYVNAAYNLKPIGEYTGKFIDFLVQNGLKLKDLHLVGLSLGAHTAGLTAKNVKSGGKVSRVTGLDPAGPLFIGVPESSRLTKDDAEFVDIIHTNGLVYGYPVSMGHADFWVNGGDVFFQPGCSPLTFLLNKPLTIKNLEYMLTCSHIRSMVLFAVSINQTKDFPATKCGSFIGFKTGFCNKNDKVYMGAFTDTNANGNYYLSTNGSYPLK